MKNEYIGLIANDSPGLLTGILGILKSGNIFVPISPTSPNHRICFIIKDCGIKILLVDRANYSKAMQVADDCPSLEHILCIEDDMEEEIPVALPEVKTGDVDQPCYLIYTSGSTGLPKGVPVTHRNLIPLFSWFRDYFELGTSTRVMQNLSYVFDFGVFEILTTLLYGCRLYIPDKGNIGDFAFYGEYINRHLIDTVHSTPVFFSNLVSAVNGLPGVRTIHLGGERLTGKMVRDISWVVSPDCVIHNGYGPTEATINCSIFSLTAAGAGEFENQAGIPIGRPTAWNNLFIYDKNHFLQPVGAAGELCVGGAGLARGYLNRPELTFERFVTTKWVVPAIPKPHSPTQLLTHSTIYRTGDLTRWLADGNIEFLGRIDFQVKIRGFRIELGEIESRLLVLNEIKEAIVVAREKDDHSNYLCAYYTCNTPNNNGPLPVSRLREHLGATLPDYMVPAHFVLLDRMPLTVTGKLDRKQLPEPDYSKIDTGVEYIAPESETEIKLAGIWKGLLQVEQIGVSEDFFELGGDSILANQCIARIRETFAVEVPLRKFFQQPFIRVIAAEIEKKEQQALAIPRADRKEKIPLSFAQERLWFLQELDGENASYFVPRVIRVNGQVRKELFERTFTEIIRRHEILRTRFHAEEGVPCQYILKPYDFTIPVLDWAGIPESRQLQQVEQWLREEGRRKFDFDSGQLLRVTLLRLKPEEYLLVLTEHHLVHDGWTQGVLLNEFIEIYSAYSKGENHQLPQLAVQYADFSVWQRQTMQGEVLATHLAYWKKQLWGKPEILELPTDKPRPERISGEGDMIEFRLSTELTQQLENFSRKADVTLFMTMLAVFKVLLYRYSGEEDLCVGTGLANRRCKEMEGMLGMVINSLPIRTCLHHNPTFFQFLKQVKETCLEAYQYQDTPFGKIVEALQPQRSLRHTPVFQVMFNFMDTPGGDLQLPDLEMTLEPSHNRSAKFDVHLVVVPPREPERNREILVEWEYNTDIFNEDTMLSMIDHFTRLLESAITHPAVPVAIQEMISHKEIAELLVTFNTTTVDYPVHMPVHGFFLDQADLNPDYIALIGHSDDAASGPVQVTYNEMNRKARQWADQLNAAGVGKDVVVAVRMERSIEMVIGIYAILMAGGAYMPVEPGYPEERITYMLRDSGARMLNREMSTAEFSTRMVERPYDNQSLAYIIYTSGSTGKPKGVMMTHSPVVNVLWALQEYYPLNAGDVYLFKTPFVFDVSVTELFGWALGGGRLCILEKGGEKDPGLILDALVTHRITHINFVPSMFGAFSTLLKDTPGINETLATLKYIFLAGEALPSVMVEEFRGTGCNCRLENIYGPTEAAIYATRYSLDNRVARDPMPIGKPINNTHIFILNRYGGIQPLGVPGECCIGGAGLAQGYLNHPELTHDVFLATEATEDAEVIFNKTLLRGVQGGSFLEKRPPVRRRLYKTGDLARWLTDGNIEFLGRLDFQVKIRGNRIELGEIQMQLLRHPDIKDALITVRKDSGSSGLCAYVVLQKGGAGLMNSGDYPAILKKYLSVVLPEYMVPNYCVVLEHIPLTAGGKIDRSALPAPRVSVREVYAPPASEIEKYLATVWAGVLGIEKEQVGIDDNFFEMGGDSIKALQLAARLKKYKLDINVNSLFKYQTIRALAKQVKRITRIISQDIVTGDVPLTPIQQWYFHQYPTDNHHFNQAVILFRETGFNETWLQRIFTRLITHHDALRMTFKKEKNRIIQINPGVEGQLFYFQTVELGQQEDNELESVIREKAALIQAGMNLSTGPLVRLGLFKTRSGDHLLIVIHHLVVDGVSWRILLEDFSTAYSQLENGEDIKLPEKTDSYCYWSERLRQYAQTSQLLEEWDYWKSIDNTPVVSLPVDHEIREEEKTVSRMQTCEIVLDDHLTGLLLKQANHAFRTETVDLLTTALTQTINQWTGQTRLLIHLEGHGREEIVDEIDMGRTIGWYTSLYPVLLEMGEKNSKSLAHRVKYVKETLRAIPRKGTGYLILSYLTPKELLPGTLNTPECGIVFNYLGQFDTGNSSGKHVFSESPFKSTAVYAPGMKSYFTLNISGRVMDGKLRVSIIYNGAQYEKETIIGFLDNYRLNLETLIEYCSRKETTELTPSDLVYKGMPMDTLAEVHRKIRLQIPGAGIENIYPLSPMQSGMLFHYLLNPSTAAYVEQCTIKLKGELDINRLRNSFVRLLETYDVLRSLFRHEEGTEPFMVVLKYKTLSFEYKDISIKEEIDADDYIRRAMGLDLEKKFNLMAGETMRVTVFRKDTGTYQLMWSFHHILMDGWSLGIAFNQLLQLYRNAENSDAGVMNRGVQFSSYLEWCARLDRKSNCLFWKEYLEGYDQEAVLPVERWYVAKQANFQEGYHCQQVETLDRQLTQQLNRIAGENRVTLNTVFQTAWGILLQRYNNSNDVVFGHVVSGRTPEIEDIEQMVGLLINTVPLRIQTTNTSTVSQLLMNLQQETVLMKPYELLPLTDIQAQTPLGNRLFDHLLAFENYAVLREPGNDRKQGGKGFYVEQIQLKEQSNYDFNIIISPGESIGIKLSYNSSRYSPELVQRILAHFLELLRQIALNPDARLEQLEIVPQSERYQLLEEFNRTHSPYPADTTIPDIFERQVDNHPHHCIVVGTGRADNNSWAHYLTYRELNDRAQLLAHSLLSDYSVGSIVGILMGPSLEMIIAILAILKTNAAYLPINPEIPAERLNYILADTQINTLITNRKYLGTGQCPVPICDMNQYLSNEDRMPTEPSPVPTGNPAYIMYTSGTTGLPKGVMVEHRNIIRLVKNTNYLCFQGHHRILQTGSPDFDATTFEIWGALLNCGQLVMAPKQDILLPHRLKQLIRTHHITTLWNTASLFNQIVAEEISVYKTLCYLLVGGDVLNPVFINRVREKYPSIKMINGYGPTENTTFSTSFLIDREYTHSIPIGKPIANSTAYIVDRWFRLQPIGAVGELLVGGDGVSRGYMNNPEQTAQRFIRFNDSTIFRTGDMARWQSDGNIDFLGRQDRQVKIRGFRIEPGEIESQLLTLHAVGEAVVIAGKEPGGDKYLCAYIVLKSTRGDEDISVNRLKEHLEAHLPAYMIPAHFVFLEKIPLTANGKIDVPSLPKPESGDGSDQYSPPRDEVERQLVEIWADILALDKTRIGINTSFFDLGGHSLKATALMSRVHKQMGVTISLSEFFSNPFVSNQATFIRKAIKEEVAVINPVEEKEYYPLSSAQERIFILEQVTPGTTAYNVTQAYSLNGSLDIQRLEDSFRQVVQRHESLRTTFHLVSGKPIQRIHTQVTFEIDPETIIRPFDLTQAPLLRVAVIRNPQQIPVLIVDMHHIITDGISQDIIARDLMSQYTETKNDPPLRLRYRDFVYWQAGEEQQTRIRLQSNWWLKVYRDEIQSLEIPTDKPRPSIRRFEGARLDFVLEEDVLLSLKDLAATQGATLFMVMLTMITLLLSKLSGKDDVVVGTPVAARNHADLKSLVGMFVNTLAMRNFPHPAMSLKQFLNRVKENTLHALENQEYPFETLVQQLALDRETGNNPLFDVVLSFHPRQTTQFRINEEEILLPYPINSKTAKFDITFIVVENQDILSVGIEYCTALFNPETIRRYMDYLRKLCTEMPLEPDKSISQTGLIDRQEKQKILFDFNHTRQAYPRHKTINELMQEQTGKTPHTTAIVGRSICQTGEKTEPVSITYGELNHRSHYFAGELYKSGVRPGTVTAIILERSVEMIIALLAILKTNCAYLPINPENPLERMNYMMADAQINTLITDRKYLGTGQCSVPICDINQCLSGEKQTWTGQCPVPAGNPAYIMYTSGTTGQPKGVMVEHWNVIRLVKNTGFLEFRQGMRLIQTGALEFDASTLEIWGTLLNGMELYLFNNREVLAPDTLKQLIQRHSISIMWMTSPLFNRMIQVDTGIFAGLKTLLAGGDVLSTPHINRLMENYPEIAIINGYGPTENTTFSTTYRVTGPHPHRESIPIGKPITNSTAFIVDRNDCLQPVGIPGELIVGGDGVARGYMNNPELTAQKFICPLIHKYYYGFFLKVHSPTHPLNYSTFYRTGDLAKWQGDGNIIFLGRKDQQVKIRGYRVEPGEVEAQLLAHEAIKEAVVEAREETNREKFLVAYIVFQDNTTNPPVEVSVIKEYLAAKSPGFMIPAHFVTLEQLPLNPSGKINRSVLPPPGHNRPQLAVSYLEPQTGTEIMIANLWKEVLGIDTIGKYDNFFQLGGTSLQLIHLHAQLKQLVQKEIALVDLFRYTNIDTLVKYLGTEEVKPGENNDQRAKSINKGKDTLRNLRKKTRS